MRSQQAACADIIVGQHLQNVCAINAHFILLAGCGERVVDEDDALAREWHLAPFAADETQAAPRVATAGAGQMYLALELLQRHAATLLEDGQGSGSRRILVPQQGQQDQLRHQR